MTADVVHFPRLSNTNFYEAARAVEEALIGQSQTNSLDPLRESDRERIHAIIEEETQRVLPSFATDSPSPQELHSVVNYVARNIFGYGPLEAPLSDPMVWEIMVNAPDAIFTRRYDTAMTPLADRFYDDDHVLRVASRLFDLAVGSHRKLDPSEGIQDAQLKDGSRLHLIHADIAKGGHLLLNIRKFNQRRSNSLHDLSADNTLSEEAVQLLRSLVRHGATIVFSGEPGSGKTTLMSACLSELDPSSRVVIAEEVFETSVSLANVAQMQVRPKRADRGEIDLRILASAFLRMAPDVAVIGEVRDKESLPFLIALSTGIQGFTTLHSSSARAALSRLKFMAQLSAAQLQDTALTQLISESIDVVVHCSRGEAGAFIDQVIAVEEARTSPGSSGFSTTPLTNLRHSKSETLRSSGEIPTRLLERIESRTVREFLFEPQSGLVDDDLVADLAARLIE